MDLPQLLLDALNDSITSGTFIDTKFYVFSCREASGRVGSPRPLYCNGRILKGVPYFSTLFSDDFSEGHARNINDTFPSDSLPYTEDYSYSSDSDLGDGEESEPDWSPRSSDSRTHRAKSEAPPRSPQGTGEINDGHQSNNASPRMGKVAIIRDMAAATFEAMIYHLYTGEITFAPFSSDSRKRPMEASAGDRNAERPPSPSAKSIYRLADKYDIPDLKEEARKHIHDSSPHSDIVEEVFSSFSHSFPEILSVQVSQLVSKMKKESEGGTESATMMRLLDKIDSLSQSQLGRAKDALSVIWNGLAGPLDSPPSGPKSAPSVKPALLPNWHRVKLALLKSILTGTFIDTQFYAYNSISDNLPLDPKPLFVSSIVIEEWGCAITTQTAGMDSQAVCLADGLTDDYEGWCGENQPTPPNGKALLEYRTEVINGTESQEAVILISGAWKTWNSLFSYAYTDRMAFVPLQTPTRPVGDAETRRKLSCSPRSMYSLATGLGIKNIMKNTLRDIQSKLTASNITQELFTPFAANHKAVMDMEIESFHKTFTGQNPKALMDHIERMASGEAQFFPTTLSLLYGKLARKALTQPAVPGSGLGGYPGAKNCGLVKHTTPQDQVESVHHILRQLLANR